MNNVIIVNLQGRAYQIEENGHKILKKYLDQAEAGLEKNPDKEEIMADLEQAIAEKCDKYLNAHKNVITSKEIEKILKEMGPVDDAEPSEKTEEKTSQQDNSVKKLYQVHEGAMISGVCSGLAAYFNIDVTLIRIAFVILTILTHGAFILVYFIMMIIVPHAYTSEEKAAAYGKPFNTQELIDRARKNFESEGWRNQWKQNYKNAMANSKKNWKRSQKHWKHNHTENLQYGALTGAKAIGVMMVIISIVWIIAIISLITKGSIFGFILPQNIPLWVGIIALLCIYNIIILPLIEGKNASFHQGMYGMNAQYYSRGSFRWIFWLGCFVFLGWAAYTYFPQTHIIGEKLQEFWNSIAHQFNNSSNTSQIQAPALAPTSQVQNPLQNPAIQ